MVDGGEAAKGDGKVAAAVRRVKAGGWMDWGRPPGRKSRRIDCGGRVSGWEVLATHWNLMNGKCVP